MSSKEIRQIFWLFPIKSNKRHPREMSGREIEEFLTHLAVKENVAASTQNQALNAILFLYREVLKQELDLKVNVFPQYLTI
ncbi:phage integrase N-terminal SAM-like domain-containing protein [Myxosarcina sp. GI1(2024)]